VLKSSTAKILFVIALMCGTASAQQAVITGQVMDSQGAVVPAAVVSALNASGASYQTVSDKNGDFQFPGLAAADYTVKAEAPGFGPAVEKLTLLVGQTVNVSMKLPLAGTIASVLVSSDVGAIDTTSSQVAGNIDPDTFQKIPLNGRNYMDLATLIPGIRRNAITNYAPLGTLNGGREQFNLDGQQVTSNGADTSFGQAQFSRDAISQFQIITNQFDATQGRTAQLAMNMQSKSGGNTLHGSAFGYFRNSVFDASDPITKTVLPFSDQQYGGSFGGHVIKDKLWYFGSFEAEHRPQVSTTTPIGFAPKTFNYSNTLNNKEYLVRGDYQPGARDHIFGRWFRYDTSSPDLLPSGNSSISRQYTNNVHPYGYVGSWTRNISTNLVNTFFGGWYYTSNLNSPLVPSFQLTFPLQVVGAAYNYPSHLPVSVFQFRDDAFWLKGKHSFKVGFEYLRELNDGSFPQNIRGVASLSSNPNSYTTPTAANPAWNNLTWDQIFPNQLDPTTWNYAVISPNVTSYTQGFGNFNTNIKRNILGMWIQDDWKLRPRLTVNLGLRYDNDIGLITAGNDTVNGIVTPKKGNNANFAPRAGFAYDLFGAGKTVLRGGAGIYFAEIIANQSIDAQLFNGVQTVQAAVASTAFGSSFNIQNPFAGQDTSTFIKNAQNIIQAIQPQAPTIRTPWGAQFSAGLQQELPFRTTASLDFTGMRVHHDWVRHDDNVAYDPTTGWNQTVKIAQGTKCPNPGGCITAHVQPNPHYSTINQFATPDGVGSLLKTMQVSIRKQTSFGVTGFVSYTYGLEKDNSNGPFTYASNPYNLQNEWANSVDDQRHTLAINANYQAKWGINGGLVYHYGSGLTYATTNGTSPTALVSSASSSRSFCYGKVGVLQTGSICSFVNENSYTPAVYNPAYHNHYDPVTGLTTVDRNSFRGLPNERIDANLAKVITIKERFKVTPQVEAFNLFNHSNYGSYNTVITSPTFGAPTATSGVLAFFARQLQFSARLDF
jgi:Carboxypeptidase regulatory-like domain